MQQNSEKYIGHNVGLLGLTEEPEEISKAHWEDGFPRETFYDEPAAVEDGFAAAATRTRPKPVNAALGTRSI